MLFTSERLSQVSLPPTVTSSSSSSTSSCRRLVLGLLAVAVLAPSAVLTYRLPDYNQYTDDDDAVVANDDAGSEVEEWLPQQVVPSLAEESSRRHTSVHRLDQSLARALLSRYLSNAAAPGSLQEGDDQGVEERESWRAGSRGGAGLVNEAAPSASKSAMYIHRKRAPGGSDLRAKRQGVCNASGIPCSPELMGSWMWFVCGCR